jgi:short-subunit dehydrogenase
VERKTIVIVGATSSIASHCVRLWAQEGPLNLVLVGRDVPRLERIASDIKVRSPESLIRIVQADFLDPEAIQLIVDDITKEPLDIALIAHGALPEQSACQNNLQTCRESLEINGISPVLFAEAFARPMALANRGTIVMIGSVAGDRGRKSNYVYGSAKAMLDQYTQGLQHRFARTGVNVILIKPGPTDTPMTAQLKTEGVYLASVNDVARRIVIAIEKGRRITYVPGQWAIIMWIIRHLPGFIFRKLNI